MGRFRPPYADYVMFCMKFYSRHLSSPRFRTEVEKNNWHACHEVIKQYSDRDKDILVYVYGAFDTLGDNVYAMANKYHIHQNIIWDMMKEFERKVAVERGLCI